MERCVKLIEIWNAEFTNYPLTVADLKKPHSMFGAYFLVFNRLGIDVDTILSPPPEEERDEHTIYYWDLLPVINLTRVINHILAILNQTDRLPNYPLLITQFLQPDSKISHCILLLLFNLMVFYENRLQEIAPSVEELFGKREQVKTLEERKNQLLQMLNDQAEEKGKRAERLEKIDYDINQFEEELRQERELNAEARLELDAAQDEVRRLEQARQQRAAQRDALLDEVAQKRALRVYDAEEVLAKVEKAAADVQEAEEKINALKAEMVKKEGCLKNLQQVQPALAAAHALCREVSQLSGDLNSLESDAPDPAQQSLSAELLALEAQLQQLQAARRELDAEEAAARAERARERDELDSALREAKEKDRKCREDNLKDLRAIEEIKEESVQCLEERKRATAELEEIAREFSAEISSFEESLIGLALEAKEKLEDKLRSS